MVFSKSTRRRIGVILIILLVVWVAFSLITGENLGIFSQETAHPSSGR